MIREVILSGSATEKMPGKWQIERDLLIREYEFSGLPLPQPTGSLRIECWVPQYPSGTIGTEIKFVLRPYLYLLHDQQPFPDHYVTPPFLVGLTAAGSGQGTEADPILRGGLIEVSAFSIEEQPDTAVLPVNPRDVALVVRTISTGEKLTFTIYTHEAEPPVKLRLELSNDQDFARLYRVCYLLAPVLACADGDDELTPYERFEIEHPWMGPRFAWFPVDTLDLGRIWLRQYWERYPGIRFASKRWFRDP